MRNFTSLAICSLLSLQLLTSACLSQADESDAYPDDVLDEMNDADKASQKGVLDKLDLFKGVVVVVSGETYCGGTFVSKKHVLTAANCIESKAGNEVKVHVKEDTKWFDVTYDAVAIIHPGYDSESMENAIAVIELQGQGLSEDAALRSVIPVSTRNDYTFAREPAIYVGVHSGLFFQGDFSTDRFYEHTRINSCWGMAILSDKLCDWLDPKDSIIDVTDPGGAMLLAGEPDEYSIIGVRTHQIRSKTIQVSAQLNYHFDFFNEVAPLIMQTAHEYEAKRQQ